VRSLNTPVMNRTSHDHRLGTPSELRFGSLTPLASMSPREPLKSQIVVGFATGSDAPVKGSTSAGENQGISSPKKSDIIGEPSGSWLGMPLPGLAASAVLPPQGKPVATAPRSGRQPGEIAGETTAGGHGGARNEGCSLPLCLDALPDCCLLLA